MPSHPPPAQTTAAKRGRGRPPRSQTEVEAIRRVIKGAAARVFSAHGYHGVSVELILQEGGISRPTFYRYFKNTDEVVELILREANDALIEAVVTAMRQASGPMQKIEVGLLAWRSWGEDMGPLLRAIFAELNDPQSPAAVHRQRVLDVIGQEMDQTMVALGRKPLDPMRVGAFVIGVEYLGYLYHFGPEGPSEALWQRTRQAMLRLAIGMLGGPLEWGQATQLAEVLGIPLD
jgi:TetR/AcrR family transcriptional regulator